MHFLRTWGYEEYLITQKVLYFRFTDLFLRPNPVDITHGSYTRGYSMVSGQYAAAGRF